MGRARRCTCETPIRMGSSSIGIAAEPAACRFEDIVNEDSAFDKQYSERQLAIRAKPLNGAFCS